MLGKVKKNKKLIITLSIILVAYVLLNALLVYVESFEDGVQIKNFGDSVWYSYVTLTTLGYGDVLPISWAGKFIGAIFILGSIITLSYVVGKVTDYLGELSERKKMGHNGTNFKNHIVIIGWDNFSQMIVNELIKSKKQVAVIIDDKNQLELLLDEYSKDQIFLLFSAYNNFQMYEKVNIKEAKIAFINHGNDTDKLVYVINMRRQFPDLKVMLSLEESNLKDTFETAGVTYVLSKNEISSKIIASFIFEPDVANYTVDLLESAEEGNGEDYDIQQYKVNNKNPYINKTYGEAFIDIKKKYNSVMIGIAKATESGKNDLLKLPADGTMININDYLILITEGSAATRIEKDFDSEQGD